MNRHDHLVVGIGAIARVGKDTMAKALAQIAKEKGYFVKISPLAAKLKDDLDSFLLSRLGVSAWTEDSAQKTVIRGILVSYGKSQRIQSNGTYWTSIVEDEVTSWSKGLDKSLVIIPDIRYDEYPNDEVSWIKNKMGGKLVYLDRLNSNGEAFSPANDDEKINAPKVKAKADVRVVWSDFSGEERDMIAAARPYAEMVWEELLK
jgi:hypothetical protein